MTTQTISYELLIRFTCLPGETPGQVKTFMATDAAANLDDQGKIIQCFPQSPRDLTANEQTQYFGALVAPLTTQLKAERDKATADAATAAQALTAAQTKAASDLQAAQTAAAADKAAAVKAVQDQLDAANADKATLTKQFSELQSVCGLTDGGAALLAQQKTQAANDALNAALATAKAMNIDVVAVATQAAAAVQQVSPPVPEPPVRVQA